MTVRRLESKPVFADRLGRRCAAPGGPQVRVMGELYELPCIRPAEPGDHTPNHREHCAMVDVDGDVQWYGWETE